jgi:hypothetical protein
MANISKILLVFRYILLFIIIILLIIGVHNLFNVIRGITYFSRNSSNLYFSENNIIKINILSSDQLIERWVVKRECIECWENIRIGSEDYIRAAKILSANSLFGQVIVNTPISKSQKYYHLTFTWFERESVFLIKTKLGDAYFDINTGRNIFVQLNIPSITLGEIIKKIGEPTELSIYKGIPFETGHNDIWDIQFIYLEKGIAFRVIQNNSYINEEVKVTSILFFKPGVDGFNAATNSAYKNLLKTWNGYGEY